MKFKTEIANDVYKELMAKADGFKEYILPHTQKFNKEKALDGLFATHVKYFEMVSLSISTAHDADIKERSMAASIVLESHKNGDTQ